VVRRYASGVSKKMECRALTTNAVSSSGRSGSTSSAKRSPGRTCSTISARPAFQTPKLSLT
jgi:hypothetical protein